MMTDGVRPLSGPCALHFSNFVLDWNKMEPLLGTQRMWVLVETSNADQNGHETLVKVGRIFPELLLD